MLVTEGTLHNQWLKFEDNTEWLELALKAYDLCKRRFPKWLLSVLRKLPDEALKDRTPNGRAGCLWLGQYFGISNESIGYIRDGMSNGYIYRELEGDNRRLLMLDDPNEMTRFFAPHLNAFRYVEFRNFVQRWF